MIRGAPIWGLGAGGAVWRTVWFSPVWGDSGSHQPLAQLPDLSPLPGALSLPRLPRSFGNSDPNWKKPSSFPCCELGVFTSTEYLENVE